MELSLTTALGLLAAVVLLAVLLQGWWRMRRVAARRALAPADGRSGDSGLDERVEPALDAAGGAQDATPGAVADTGPDTVPDPQALPMPRTPVRRTPALDPLIDALVPLVLESPLRGEFVLQHLPATRRAGGKPFLIEGLDTETADWVPPQPGRHYGELQAGVQLANRSGPLNEIEFSEFVQTVEAFAEAVGARADVPDMLEVVVRARELDALASPLDAQLTLTLRASGVAWSVPYVQQVAARAGLVPGSVAGRYVLPAAEEGAPPVLTLSVDAQAALAALAGDAAASAVRECLLVLDVAQTPESAEPYPAWHRCATQLADELDAEVVDDHGQPITLQAFSAIGREVAEVYQRLQALDLAAGSPAARRVFS